MAKPMVHGRLTAVWLVAAMVACGDSGDDGGSADAGTADATSAETGTTASGSATQPSGPTSDSQTTSETETGSTDDTTTGGTGPLPIDQWARHLVDDSLSGQVVFVGAADLDDDGGREIVAGPNWYKTDGPLEGPWTGTAIGGSLQDMAALWDIDEDGDVDVLGTNGAEVMWAENDGAAGFDVHAAATADGDFLQGVAVAEVSPGVFGAALSWHEGGKGVQLVTVPGNPAGEAWPYQVIHPQSEDEALSAGDIDDDGDIDLFQGSQWLRNDGGSWSQLMASDAGGLPDRNRLADVDGDGDLDAIIGFEGEGTDVIWLEAPDDPTGLWTVHMIDAGVGGGFSMDVGDLDLDGDPDVVLGEHRGTNGENRVIIYENEGAGASWAVHVIDGPESGIDHHDGTRIVDVDNDGDPDLCSIGWYNVKVWVFENLAL